MEPSALNTVDFLYLALAIGAIILVVVIAVAIVNTIFLIRDIRKISSVAGDVTEKFHEVVMTPISVLSSIANVVSPHVENFVKNKVEDMSADKPKKKKK
jgi:hypothetical protein